MPGNHQQKEILTILYNGIHPTIYVITNLFYISMLSASIGYWLYKLYIYALILYELYVFLRTRCIIFTVYGNFSLLNTKITKNSFSIISEF